MEPFQWQQLSFCVVLVVVNTELYASLWQEQRCVECVEQSVTSGKKYAIGDAEHHVEVLA